MSRILQIIAPTVPANAVFETNRGANWGQPVELWALVEDDQGKQEIIGMSSDGQTVMVEIETLGNKFVGYELAVPEED